MRQTKKLIDLHSNARMEFDKIQASCREQRDESLEDRRFATIAGAQWEGNLSDQYENRPKFEVNKVHLSVIRIINQYRNNRITVDFVPKTGGEDKLAELCNNMYRADEQDSNAMEAYDNAFEEAALGGMGAYRIRSCYEDEYDEENEKQVVKIEPIYDADISVYFDLDAKLQDKSDAKSCFVLSSMTHDAFIDQFGEEPTSWPNDVNTENFDWWTPDVVYVAEYYKVEENSETKIYFETVTGEEECYWEEKLDEDKLKRFKEIGTKEVRRRNIKQRQIHKYIMSGNGVLEDCGIIAGKEIPIVPVYGKRWFIQNIERFMGHVRLAKDAQRLKNMQLSKLGEISSLSTVEKPILTPEQIAGHANMWRDDNIEDYPYLLINPITNEEGQTVAQGPIGYTKASEIPPALAALLQITEQDMKDVLGHYEQGEQIVSHISGKAIEKVNERLDMQCYIYMSNLAKAMRRGGQIWLSQKKDTCFEDEREVKVIYKNGKYGTGKIKIMAVGEDGLVGIQNDLDDANFDVTAEVGPSSQSERDKIVEQTNTLIQYEKDPETQAVLGATSMMNMAGDGLSDIREFSRKKLLKMGVGEPNDKDLKELEANPPEPSANDKYLIAEAKRAESEVQKNEADNVETMANAELKKAQAQQIMFEMGKPPEQPAQQSAPPKDYKEEEIMTKAYIAKAELDLKEREVAIKEEELRLKIAMAQKEQGESSEKE